MANFDRVHSFCRFVGCGRVFEAHHFQTWPTDEHHKRVDQVGKVDQVPFFIGFAKSRTWPTSQKRCASGLPTPHKQPTEGLMRFSSLRSLPYLLFKNLLFRSAVLMVRRNLLSKFDQVRSTSTIPHNSWGLSVYFPVFWGVRVRRSSIEFESQHSSQASRTAQALRLFVQFFSHRCSP